MTLPNAICIHEEDDGHPLEARRLAPADHAEVRRSRRLVVSFIATVGNYEYGFYWYFYQDGTIELEVKMTGIISNGAEPPGVKPPWGELVAPQVYGPIHQHFFNARLDMMVDGLENSVYEVNTVADPPGPGQPASQRLPRRGDAARSEASAPRVIDPLAGRFWKVVNPSVRNRLGEPVAYKLMPGDNVLPFAGPEASVTKRAAFMTRHLWVTRHDPRERYAAGDYPNQHAGGAGLPSYVQDDAPLENTDVVLWYTFGAHHVVRPGGLAGDARDGDRLHAQAQRASSTGTPPSTCRDPCPMGPAPTAARHATPRDRGRARAVAGGDAGGGH